MDATAPEIHQLPALSGCESTVYYFKTQENVVTIFGVVGKNNGTFDAWEPFAQVPVGFGSNLNICVAAVVSNGQNPGASMVIQYYGYNTNQIRTTNAVPAGTTEIAFMMTYVATK